MDLESLNLHDKRNRFQVNRVDTTVATAETQSQHDPDPSATLVGYKEYSKKSLKNRSDLESEDGRPTSAGSRPRASFAEMHDYGGTQRNSTCFEPKFNKSFRHYTREALPKLENYRNMMSIQAAYRPTLEELHDCAVDDDKSPTGIHPTGQKQEGSTLKFGWIKGVLVRCLLNIWGVMLFLRLSWVVGQAGIIEACIIIMLATAVTLLTAISMSAISTNGTIKGGGTYFMISRSLGPEFGASIGAIFSLANAIAVAMYTVGFAESMVDLLKSYGTYVVEDPTNSVRIIGTVAIVFQTFVVVIGMEWEASAQVGLLAILVAAMVDFVIGSFIGPTDSDELSKGFIGYNTSVFIENLGSNYRFTEGTQQNFFSVFSIFFPAATGILAGANISGNLEDPQYSIPKGTLLAIFVTTASYLAFALISGACVVRDATGPLNLTDPSDWTTTFAEFRNCYSYNETTGIKENLCTSWGLMNNFQVMELVSAWGLLIYLGCFAATLSSALASFVSAPKVFQALCNDKLYPYIESFGRGYGKNNEPVRGYILTFIIALGFILIAELNAIAPLISNFFVRFKKITFAVNSQIVHPENYNLFRRLLLVMLKQGETTPGLYYTRLGSLFSNFALYSLTRVRVLLGEFTLAAYALVNFSTFHVSLAKPVGWRPTFKYFNMWLSLVGAILCVAVMFLISWVTALLTFGVILFLYMVVTFHKPDVNWGSSTQAQTYKTALTSVQQLNAVHEHCKNYRPQILVLSGMPSTRPTLVDFAYLITKQLSLIVCGQVFKTSLTNRQRALLREKAQSWFSAQKIKAFYCVIDDLEFEEGAKALLQAYGVGKLRPNILMMGFKQDWATCDDTSLNQYFNVIHKSLDLHLSVCILRVSGGFDLSKQITFGKETFSPLSNYSDISKSKSTSTVSLPKNLSNHSFCDVLQESNANQPIPIEPTNPSDSDFILKSLDGGDISPNVLEKLSLFKQKHKDGTIDVYWLYDDGGLTLLLPYIINTRRSWASCKLRVFALANRKDEFDTEHRRMAGLLSKFRIDYSDLKIIPDINLPATARTKANFERLLAGLKNDEKGGSRINPSELLVMKDKTNRHLRLRELLLENSKDSTLVVMTLPMPRRNAVSAELYMAWLEILTAEMPPFLFVRGNQASVLTFYS